MDRFYRRHAVWLVPILTVLFMASLGVVLIGGLRLVLPGWEFDLGSYAMGMVMIVATRIYIGVISLQGGTNDGPTPD